jgi:hypothetical protein
VLTARSDEFEELSNALGSLFDSSCEIRVGLSEDDDDARDAPTDESPVDLSTGEDEDGDEDFIDDGFDVDETFSGGKGGVGAVVDDDDELLFVDEAWLFWFFGGDLLLITEQPAFVVDVLVTLSN